MDEDSLARQQRLAALHARVISQHATVSAETRTLIDELVELVHSLDPIKRKTLWPAQLIQFIAQRQNWICPACGGEIPSLNERAHHVDHVIPWSFGGGNEPSNLQILHATCNLSKGQRCNLDELIQYLQGRLLNL